MNPIIAASARRALRFAPLAALLVLGSLALPPAAAFAAHHHASESRPREPLVLGGLDPDEQALWQRVCYRVEDSFDSTAGGFVSHGVMSESAVDLAFLLGRRAGQERWKDRGDFTARWMLGLEDSVGGGFYVHAERVAGQNQFQRPTRLNARRLENLIEAWEATNDTRYWVTAVRLLEFADRNVVDGRGGFTSDPVGDQDLVPDVNGVAVHAWLRWWATARDSRCRDFAYRSIDRVWASAWRDSLGFVRTDSFGELLALPQLADQTEMGRALVLSAKLGGRPGDLVRARRVADLMIRRYTDKVGAFRSAMTLKKGRFTRMPGRDAVENARAALFLCELSSVAGDARYLGVARTVWRVYARDIDKSKLGNADWALALDAAVAPVFPVRPPDSAPPIEHRKMPRTNGRSRLPETRIGAETGR